MKFNLFGRTAQSEQKTKKIVTKVVKSKVREAKEAFSIILPGQNETKKEAKFKETIEVIDKLLKKSGYIDNVKTDTLRKFVIFLDQDVTFKNKEKMLMDWLKADAGIKTVKKLNVTVTKS